MSRIRHQAVAAAAAALISVAAVIPVASADIAVFPDPYNFPDDGGHVSTVRVSHGPTTIGVTANDRDLSDAIVHQFWLDTYTGDPGPEYRVQVFRDSSSVVLEKVTNVGSPGIKVPCSGLQRIRQLRTETGGYAKIIVSRRCVGTPAQVRVSISSTYASDGFIEWTPTTYGFFPWVYR